MQDKNYIKPFPCSLHPTESIQKISIEMDVDNPLKCIECIMHENRTSNLLPFDAFIEKIISQCQNLPQTSSIKTDPPHEFIDFLAHEEEKVQRLSIHIEHEKKKVNLAFNALIQEFTKICNSRKEKLITQLDKQLTSLQLNYQYYKNKINKHYTNQIDLWMKDQDAFLQKINQCQDTNHLEFLIKGIKEDIYDSTLPHQQATLFTCLAKDLKQRSDLLPRSQLSSQDNEVLSSKLSDLTKSFFDSFSSIEPQIPSLASSISLVNSLTLDSLLVQNQDERYLLKKWLAPKNEDIQLKLLYRGSRDGMNHSVLQEKCKNYPNTLVIAKSNFGKILGGFSDQPWSGTAASLGWQKSEKAFLFSMTEKQKFPIMRRHIHSAVYVHQNSGLAFGNGHDLMLHFSEFVVDQETFEIQSHDTNLCYSVLGRSYDNQGDINKTLLGGAQKFDIEEIEILSVESLKN